VADDVVTRLDSVTIEYGDFSSSFNRKGREGFRKGRKEKLRKGGFAATLGCLCDLDYFFRSI